MVAGRSSVVHRGVLHRGSCNLYQQSWCIGSEAAGFIKVWGGRLFGRPVLSIKDPEPYNVWHCCGERPFWTLDAMASHDRNGVDGTRSCGLVGGR